MASNSIDEHGFTRQFAVLSSVRKGIIVPSVASALEERKEDEIRVRSRMAELLEKWPFGWDKRTPPCQLHVPSSTLQTLQRLDCALNKASINIIERWFDDHEADFSQRMPLAPHEERALKWIAGSGSGLVPPFRRHQGIVRPDFLYEQLPREDGTVYENVRICEINSRLPFNTTMLTYYTYKLYESYDLHLANLKSVIDPKVLLSTLFSLFDTSLPVHGVVEKAAFLGEIFTFASLYEKAFGKPFKIVKPADLRLIPDESSETGFSLYCILEKNEARSDTIEFEDQTLEPVSQLALTLFQEEYEAWSFEMMCQIATQCPVNDLRTTFLLNDQRFLGIILEELDNLVDVHQAITSEEAAWIRDGLVPTTLCTSATWNKIISECQLDPTRKDDWVIKSGRDGIGHGHVFGNSVNNEEWLAKMDSIQTGESLNESAFCLQKLVRQREYDIIRHNIEELENYYLIGAYLAVQGVYQGASLYRLGRQMCVRLNDDQQGLVMYPFTDR